MTVIAGTFDYFENSQMKVSDLSKVAKIFSLAQNFLKILLVNSHNIYAKHVNLQVPQTPVFDERCYQYTQSMRI